MKELVIKRKNLVWDKWNRNHIKKHQLTPRQAEQVLYDPNKVIQEAAAGRLMVIGQCGKRLVSLIVNATGKKFYLVTARDADHGERKIYRENLL